MGTDARVQKLLADVAADVAAWEVHLGRVENALARAPWDAQDPDLFLVAVSLHHGYGALESAFERIARAFEGLPDKSERWHQELLRAMGMEIPGVRPAVLRAETLSPLREVLGFRHFFRHAYAADFEPSRLELAARSLVLAGAAVRADLDVFLGNLRASLP